MASLFIFTSGAAFSMPRYLGKFTVTSPESSKILQVVNRGEIEIFFDLVAANPRILNLRLNTNEDTPLHVAARMGNLKFVQCLIRAGADCNCN